MGVIELLQKIFLIAKLYLILCTSFLLIIFPPEIIDNNMQTLDNLYYSIFS